MSTRLYYYTGTGNSLWVARQLAGRLDGEVELVSLGADYELPGADSDRVGLVFPVHMWGLPQHVRDFAARLPAAPGRYVFALAVNAGLPPAPTPEPSTKTMAAETFSPSDICPS